MWETIYSKLRRREAIRPPKPRPPPRTHPSLGAQVPGPGQALAAPPLPVDVITPGPHQLQALRNRADGTASAPSGMHLGPLLQPQQQSVSSIAPQSHDQAHSRGDWSYPPISQQHSRAYGFHPPPSHQQPIPYGPQHHHGILDMMQQPPRYQYDVSEWPQMDGRVKVFHIICEFGVEVHRWSQGKPAPVGSSTRYQYSVAEYPQANDNVKVLHIIREFGKEVHRWVQDRPGLASLRAPDSQQLHNQRGSSVVQTPSEISAAQSHVQQRSIVHDNGGGEEIASLRATSSHTSSSQDQGILVKGAAGKRKAESLQVDDIQPAKRLHESKRQTGS